VLVPFALFAISGGQSIDPSLEAGVGIGGCALGFEIMKEVIDSPSSSPVSGGEFARSFHRLDWHRMGLWLLSIFAQKDYHLVLLLFNFWVAPDRPSTTSACPPFLAFLYLIAVCVDRRFQAASIACLVRS